MIFTVQGMVQQSQIDHNAHMHDADYNYIFSDAINQFNYTHGLPLAERQALHYTIFTVEEHTTYLAEMSLGEHYIIQLFIYNYDDKRIHFFLKLIKENGTLAATNEVMMLGIDSTTRKAAAFPEPYFTEMTSYYKTQDISQWPKQLGHQIGIPNKG